MEQTELFAAETLLQRGVKVQIVAPLLLRLFGKRFISIVIRQPYYGTLLRISSYYLRTGITADRLERITTENALKLSAEHGKNMSKAVATAILNGWIAGILFTNLVAFLLRWKLSPQKICAITEILVRYGGTKAFINTTELIADHLIVTAPNPGQQKQGS